MPDNFEMAIYNYIPNTNCCVGVLGAGRAGEVRKRQAEQYVRRRKRQNVTMGGQPAAPFEALGAEVLVVQVLGHLLQILHVGAGQTTGTETVTPQIAKYSCPTHKNSSNRILH